MIIKNLAVIGLILNFVGTVVLAVPLFILLTIDDSNLLYRVGLVILAIGFALQLLAARAPQSRK